jgi:hypothetical protein
MAQTKRIKMTVLEKILEKIIMRQFLRAIVMKRLKVIKTPTIPEI